MTQAHSRTLPPDSGDRDQVVVLRGVTWADYQRLLESTPPRSTRETPASCPDDMWIIGAKEASINCGKRKGLPSASRLTDADMR